MKKLLLFIFILTLLDAAATIVGVKLGYLGEANPLFFGFMNNYPVAAGCCACVMTGLLLRFLYPLRRRISWMRSAMAIVAVVKISVLYLHVVFAIGALNSLNLLSFT